MAGDALLIRRELESYLIDRALQDDGFRRRLIADPKAALEAELSRLNIDIRLPTNLQVKVLEERPDTLYLVLPPDLAKATAPSDDDLLEALQTIHLNPIKG